MKLSTYFYYKFFLVLILSILSIIVQAAQFSLEAGQSKTIRTKERVDTIFASNSAVVDYEILDDYTYVLYAKEEGTADIRVFNQNGDLIDEQNIRVNKILNDLNYIENASDQIRARFPQSNLSVHQVGKAYVIEGNAKSDIEKEDINKLVGEAIGASKTIRKQELTRAGKTEEIPFLERVEYDGVVNQAQIEAPPQINVKLSIVEVNKEFSESIGINWSNLTGTVIGGFSSMTNPSRGAYLGINANSFNAFINALNDQSNARILAEPNMSLLSGETADLLVGGEIPFATRDKDATTIVYKDFGIQMVVGAKIQKNNRIRIILSQEVSTIAGTYTYETGNIPFFNTRRSKTTVELADGESFILGGLISSEDGETLAKLPILGDIPILGAFFRHATTDRKSKELVIIATVNSVQPVNSDQIEYPNFERTGTLERFFNVTPMKNIYHKTLATNFLERGGFIQ
jgi:pilus assembly protein CpaC